MLQRIVLGAALILGASGASAQEAHVVQQVSLTFTPDEITVAVGDTVRWMFTSGSHTVTSGTGSAAPDAGSLFDEPLNAVNPVVEYVFTVPGDVSYFCRPHEGFGMTGVVHVESAGTDAAPRARTPLRVEPVRPNPFNPRAAIRFALERAGAVTVTVHDARGRRVDSLAQGRSYPAGEHVLLWDGRGRQGREVPSGVYHFRISALGRTEIVRAALVR